MELESIDSFPPDIDPERIKSPEQIEEQLKELSQIVGNDGSPRYYIPYLDLDPDLLGGYKGKFDKNKRNCEMAPLPQRIYTHVSTPKENRGLLLDFDGTTTDGPPAIVLPSVPSNRHTGEQAAAVAKYGGIINEEFGNHKIRIGNLSQVTLGMPDIDTGTTISTIGKVHQELWLRGMVALKELIQTFGNIIDFAIEECVEWRGDTPETKATKILRIRNGITDLISQNGKTGIVSAGIKEIIEGILLRNGLDLKENNIEIFANSIIEPPPVIENRNPFNVAFRYDPLYLSALNKIGAMEAAFGIKSERSRLLCPNKDMDDVGHFESVVFIGDQPEDIQSAQYVDIPNKIDVFIASDEDFPAVINRYRQTEYYRKEAPFDILVHTQEDLEAIATLFSAN